MAVEDKRRGREERKPRQILIFIFSIKNTEKAREFNGILWLTPNVERKSETRGGVCLCLCAFYYTACLIRWEKLSEYRINIFFYAIFIYSLLHSSSAPLATILLPRCMPEIFSFSFFIFCGLFLLAISENNAVRQ